MSDVENEIEMLQRKLAAKTREIEALVAKQEHLGDLDAMVTSDFARLRTHVEDLIYKWQEANVRPSLSNPDTALNRLIAEREEIEQQIAGLQVR
jgi:chromosome segregation ATPase